MKNLVQKRNASLDVIRIVAVLAVVMIHCSASFVTAYQSHMIEFVFGNLLNGMAQLGVALFLMISGALFLDERKEITLKTIISKNVKSIAVITVVWGVIYAMVYDFIVPLLKGNAIPARTVLASIVNGHGHMWYLYMIMGIYMITPFLKKFVSKENKEMVLFFIAISFVVQFLLPVADKICIRYFGTAFIGPWIDKFSLDFFGGYITYYLAGWYIVHVGIKQKHLRSIVYFMGLTALALMISYVQFTRDYKFAYAVIGAPVFLYSVSVFLLLNNITFNFKEKTANTITELSKLSFGTYLVHMLVLNVFKKLFPYSEHFVLYIFVCFATVACSSFLCAYVISKIPFTKKLIKM
jgi:surface polysaccharide O-acyltransferase-like enzyme